MNKEPISILFTIPNFIQAGSGQALLNIVRRLDRGKFSPAICVLRKGGKLDLEVENLGIPFLETSFTIPAQPYHTLISRAWRIAKIFRPYQFNLWHSFHYLDDYTEPLIAYFAGAKAWIYTKKNMNWYRRAWYLRTIFATRVAVQNHEMMEQFFKRAWARHKARLIPRGVDIQHFRPDVPQRLGLRKKLGISSQLTLICCVAHLVPVKGHHILLQAIRQLSNAALLIAGKSLDQLYADQLVKLKIDLGLDHVHFLGDVHDVPALLAEVDIFVLPTLGRGRMEGCPVALLEAMACGRACIATDIPGSRDLIEHTKSGWLVPPEDVEAMANALRRLNDSPDLRYTLGKGARKRVVEHFSIEQEVAAHEALYTELFN